MNINEIITNYLQAMQEKRDAEKRADAYKALILDHAGTADNFTTDVFTVIVKRTETTRLDTKRLYADFPDMKDVYGKTSTSTTITAVVTADAAKKTA